MKISRKGQGGVGIPAHRSSAGLGDHVVDNPLIRAYKRVQEAADHHPGQEIGQEQNRLVRLGRPAAADLVEHQRKCDRHRHVQHDKAEIVQQRVPRDGKCLVGGKQELEILKSHPRAV